MVREGAEVQVFKRWPGKAPRSCRLGQDVKEITGVPCGCSWDVHSGQSECQVHRPLRGRRSVWLMWSVEPPNYF